MSVDLTAKVEAAIARVGALPDAERRAIFTEFSPERIRAEAADLLARHASGEAMPLYGTLVSVKDLFDEAGQVTGAGSRLLADRPAARADAPAVARLKRAGALMFGRSSMSEFAYSGVGLNPHHGTPSGALVQGGMPGGLQLGRGGLRRARHHRCGDRHRHRRLAAHSRRSKRHLGLQAEPGADRRAGRASAGADLRRARPDGAGPAVARPSRRGDGRRGAGRRRAGVAAPRGAFGSLHRRALGGGRRALRGGKGPARRHGTQPRAGRPERHRRRHLAQQDHRRGRGPSPLWHRSGPAGRNRRSPGALAHPLRRDPEHRRDRRRL
ncbi:hypothetical protein CLG85_000840 [Yangia mangrovi]|uniref:Amidase domain-containing protein n=1 Tax=Alloyangia mangrovi TaxID=1779329 RepID=A0ABT2KF33_9RHOB|nr:hypothetical protein [Alloyangia mangrovi]